MATEGPLLTSVQRMIEELGESGVRELAPMPLPVRIWDGPQHSEARIDLRISFSGDDSAEGERALSTFDRLGFRFSHWRGPSVSGAAPLSALPALVDAQVDAFVEAASTIRPTLDRSVPEVWRARAGAGGKHTGKGVIVGIVDSGVDLTHPSFRTPSGETRVLSYWSQAENGPEPPGPYSYGFAWDKSQIDAKLRASLGVPVSWLDAGGHGTRVAGVAAGNGRGNPGDRYVGLAPEADLVVVSLHAGSRAFASTANVVEGIRYVYDIAYEHGKRAVVNLSQGVQIGAHEPVDSLETELAELLSEDEDRVVVVSAGNVADAQAHARFSLSGGVSAELPVTIPPFAGPAALLDIWYGVGDRLEVELVAPDGSSSGLVADRGPSYGPIGDDAYEIDGVPNVPRVAANQLQVKVHRPDYRGDLPAGRWTLRVGGAAIVDGSPVDAWLDPGRGINSPRFEAGAAEPECTVTAPATAHGAIPVGAYAMSPTRGRLAPSSGRGPDRRGSPVPLLTAPGAPIMTTGPSQTGSSDFAVAYGTSLAAAHVTGAVALMLEARPDAGRDRIAGCLRRGARSDTDTEAGPGSAWGAGKLDVDAALAGVV